jgi:hypothetical protein
MKITGIKVTLTTTVGRWVEEDIECEPRDRESVIEIIKEQYAMMGMTVDHVRLAYSEGDHRLPPPDEKDENIETLPQWHKPKMK